MWTQRSVRLQPRPRRARLTGAVLSACDDPDLPWWRDLRAARVPEPPPEAV